MFKPETESDELDFSSPDYELALGLLREVRDYLVDEVGWAEHFGFASREHDLLARVEALLGDAN